MIKKIMSKLKGKETEKPKKTPVSNGKVKLNIQVIRANGEVESFEVPAEIEKRK